MESDNESSVLLKPSVQEEQRGYNSRIKAVFSVITVEPLLLLYVFSYAGTVPVITQYLYSRLAHKYGVTDPNTVAPGQGNASTCAMGNTTSATYQALQAEVSQWTVSYVLCVQVPAILIIVFVGSYSDRAGRKIAILPTAVGGILTTVTLIATIAFSLPVPVVLLAGIFSGFSGGPGLILTAGLAYVVDISKGNQKYIRILIVDICLGFGMATANISTGFMISSLGFMYTLVVFLGMQVLYAIYGIILPETINKNEEANFFDWSNLRQTFSLYIVDNEYKRQWKIITAFLVVFTFFTIEMGSSEIRTYYFLNPPLCWDSVVIGIYTGADFLFRGCGSMIIFKCLKSRISEPVLAVLGIISSVAYNLVMAGVTNIAIALLAPLFGVASMLVLPVMQGLASNLVQPHEQGGLFAGLSWVQMLGTLIGASLFNPLYTASLVVVHGFIYMLAAIFLVIPLTLIIFLWIGIAREKRNVVID